MSGSRWSAIFALGLISGGALAIVAIIWIIGLNYCPNQPCYYSQAADDPNGNGGQRVWQVPDAVRGTFSYEAAPEYTPSNPTRHEYYDLRTQERMAHATDWIAWLTFMTGAFSFMGLGALIYTLNLQRDANQIMRDEQRPWLHVTITEITNYRFEQRPYDRDRDTAHFEIPLTITNSGGTPAVGVELRCVAGTLSAAIEKMWGGPPVPSNIMPHTMGSVPPNSSQFVSVWVSRTAPEPKPGYKDIVPASVTVEISYESPKSVNSETFSTIQTFNLMTEKSDGTRDFITPLDMMTKEITVVAEAMRSHMT